MATKKSIPKRAAGKKAVRKKAAVRRTPASANTQADEISLLTDDAEQQIRKIYSMSREEAAMVLRESGVLTAKGRLKATFK